MTFPRFDRGYYWYPIVIVVIILFTNQDSNRGPGRRTVVEEHGDLVCMGLPQDPSG